MSKTVGEIIKERLASLGKTQGWLAESANVSNTAVSKWITTGKISRESAKIISKKLDVSIDSLLFGNKVNASSETSKSLSLVYASIEELQLLTAFRESSELGKELIRAAADAAPRAQLSDLASIHNKS